MPEFEGVYDAHALLPEDDCALVNAYFWLTDACYATVGS